MIKVGIIGCTDVRAAELVRVLINHPDVEVRWVQDVNVAGVRVDHLVHGLVGECDLTVVNQGSLDEVDLVYLWVIDLSGCHNLDHGPEGPWVYGLSEMQRRLLVHDARLVTVPGLAAAAALLALMPMARNLMLNSPLTLHVAMGGMAFDGGSTTLDGLAPDAWISQQRQEIARALQQCQTSFGQPIEMDLTRLAERRTLAVAARFKCGVDDETIRQLYEQYYEDHNFVFLLDRPIVTADVENTNKCLIHLDKDERSGLLTVHAVMDLLLKGSAGTAVHVMNLMFGLHERVGLSLKGTGC